MILTVPEVIGPGHEGALPSIEEMITPSKEKLFWTAVLFEQDKFIWFELALNSPHQSPQDKLGLGQPTRQKDPDVA